MDPVKNPTTLVEAYDFVNQRYVFNEKHYPVLRHLTQPQDKKVFALTHSLLHLQKSSTHLESNENRELLAVIMSSPEPEELSGVSKNYKKAVLKMIVNFIKIAEILEIQKTEFAAIPPEIYKYSPILHGPCQDIMTAIAIHCEAADHGGILDQESLKSTFNLSWGKILYCFQNEDIFIPYELISEVMKSKEPAV